MKKILFLLCMTLLGHIVYSQNSESYLQKAYSALEEGNVEAAQAYYNVYKKITEKTDTDFEVILKDADVNAWKSSCYIIDCGNGEYIAVQKIDSSQVELSYEAAMNRCKSSRLGGFNDWRLPTYDELSIVVSNITLPLNSFYWTSYHKFSEEGDKRANSNYYLCRDEWKVINASGEENQIIWQGVWENICMRWEIYINGMKLPPYEALLRYNYIIIRKFTH